VNGRENFTSHYQASEVLKGVGVQATEQAVQHCSLYIMQSCRAFNPDSLQFKSMQAEVGWTTLRMKTLQRRYMEICNSRQMVDE